MHGLTWTSNLPSEKQPTNDEAPLSVIFSTNLISSFLRAITTPIYVGQKSVQVF